MTPSDREYHPVSEDEYVEDAATRDEVTVHLDAEGIGYVVEVVAPTVSEQTTFEQWGPRPG